MIETKFKNTGFHIIPLDWEEGCLEDYTIKIGSGATPTGGEASYKEEGISLIRSLNVYNDGFKYERLAHINKEQASELDNVTIEEGDVLVNITGASVARCCVVPNNILPARVNQHVSIVRTQEEVLNYKFLWFLLTSPLFQKELIALSKGNGGTREAITKKQLEDFLIILPSSTTEQSRIATALSDVDELIETLKKLIEKKRNIKKGAMQELLSGKRRLQGFTDKWKEMELWEICDRYDNLRVPVTASLRKEGDTPYYGANGIQDYVEGYTHNGEFILIAEDGANSLTDYPIQYVNGKVWVNNHAHVIKAKEGKADNKYLSYGLKTIDFESNVDGSTRIKLTASKLMQLKIDIPYNILEQQAIAKVLSDMDSEISILESRLTKYQSLKQGMMQRLLTGKIRLI